MIKNIIFDFGGVLYNLNFNRSFEAFKQLGFSDFDEIFSQHHASSVFQLLETGKITPEDFYKKIQNIAPNPIESKAIKNAWNAMLLDYRLNSLQFLGRLKKQYNLYLLSNTNAIHYDYFSPQLVNETNYSSLESFFTKAYFSHIIGYRKPDKEAFNFVLNDAGIKATESLFIDDTISNLQTPEEMGLKTHLLLPTERIEALNYERY